MNQQLEPFLQQFLNRLLRHSELQEGHKRSILALPVRVEDVRNRQGLVSPGHPVDHCILTGEGLLGRFEVTRSGSRQITAIYLPGDMSDLQSVVAPTPGWGIVALTSATIARIEHSALRRLAEEHPSIAFAFWRDTVLDASIFARAIAVVGHQDSKGRLAHFLCEMGIRAEWAGRGNRYQFSLDLTQEQIGDYLGLTSVHVNRTYMSLQRLGLISRKQRQISILEWERLADAAEFDPAYLVYPGERSAEL